MSISVCMATHNGERFVDRQLRSILVQLASEDEIIVVDDCSTDHTVDVIDRIHDSRIKVYKNTQRLRPAHTFGRALEMARHDYIFLADQDDIWLPGRVVLMRQALEDSGAAVVSRNFVWMNAEECPINVHYDGVRASTSRSYLRNITDIFVGKTNYFGCAMAIRREFIPIVTPLPFWVESHDLWIALASNITRTNLHANACTLRKRRHDGNATSTVSTRPLYRRLWSRVLFCVSLVILMSRHRRLLRGRARNGVVRCPA